MIFGALVADLGRHGLSAVEPDVFCLLGEEEELSFSVCSLEGLMMCLRLARLQTRGFAGVSRLDWMVKRPFVFLWSLESSSGATFYILQTFGQLGFWVCFRPCLDCWLGIRPYLFYLTATFAASPAYQYQSHASSRTPAPEAMLNPPYKPLSCPSGLLRCQYRCREEA